MLPLLSLLTLPLAGWAFYQLQRGEVYAHTGYTRFSPLAWITRESNPSIFWMTIASQCAAGIMLPCFAIVELVI